MPSPSIRTIATNLTVLSLTALLYLLTPISTVNAQVSCNRDPQYDGPHFSILFDDTDCSVYPEESPLMNEFFDYSEACLIDDPNLTPEAVGIEKDSWLDFLEDFGDGNASVDFREVANWEPRRQALDENHIELLPHLQSVSMGTQADSAFFTAECIFYGIYDTQACADFFNINIGDVDGLDRVNELEKSTEYQRTTLERTQLEDRHERARHIKRCTEGGVPPDDENCDNYYMVTPNRDSRDLANQVLAVKDMDEFRTLTMQQKKEVMSLKDSKATETFLVAVVPHVNLNFDPQNIGEWLEWLRYRLSPPEVIVGRGTIPSVINVVEKTESIQKRLSLPSKGQTMIDDVRAANYDPVPHELPFEEKVNHKIQDVTKLCPEDYSQFLGSVETTRTDTGPIWISWLFEIFNGTPRDVYEAREPMFYYQVYLIQPYGTDMVRQAKGIHKDSKTRSFYLPADTTPLDQEVAIQQPLYGQNPHAETDHNPNMVVETYPCGSDPSQPLVCICKDGDADKNGDGKCEVRADIYLSYDDVKPSQLMFKGGEDAEEDLTQKHGNAQLLGENEHLPGACYYDQVRFGLQQIGVDMDNLLQINSGQFYNPLDCSRKVDVSNFCGAGDLPPLSGAGSCRLCNTFLSSLIPPTMKAVIESAAEHYNIPASIIVGVLYGEGGFERTACYGEYTEEMITEASVCGGEIPNCRACNVSSAGAMGPYQWIPKWMPSVPPSSSRFELPDWYTGNPCNFADATYAIAARLSKDYIGSPLWEDTCDGIDLNNGSAPGHSSCGDWTREDVATAARAHRGLCHPEYQANILWVWGCNSTPPPHYQL